MNLLVVLYMLLAALLTLGADSAAADVELRDALEEFVRAAEDINLGENPSKLSRLIRGVSLNADSTAAYDDEFRADLEYLVRAADEAMPEDFPTNDLEDNLDKLSTLLRIRMEDMPENERHADFIDKVKKKLPKVIKFVKGAVKFVKKYVVPVAKVVIPIAVMAVGQ